MNLPYRRLTAILGSVVFLFVAPGLFGILIPWAMTGWHLNEPMFELELTRWLGGALALLGGGILLDSFARFALEGRGTPAPIYPTATLVVSGAYRYVRNPMYLAVISLIAGQGLLFGSVALLAYALVFGLTTHLFVRLYEEPTLHETYGTQYDVYVANVRRWMPRSTPWRGG